MNNFLKENWFKILAIVLLLWAITDNPYGYYQFLRWIITITAGYTAYIYYDKQRNGWVWTFGIMAILFNPIIPFYFSRNTWQLIDFLSAVIFIISIFKKMKNNYEKNT